MKTANRLLLRQSRPFKMVTLSVVAFVAMANAVAGMRGLQAGAAAAAAAAAGSTPPIERTDPLGLYNDDKEQGTMQGESGGQRTWEIKCRKCHQRQNFLF